MMAAVRNSAVRNSAVRLTLIGAVFVATCASEVTGQPPPGEKASDITYRLIFAPLNKIADMAARELRTMKRERFFTLVRALGEDAPFNVSRGVHLQRATYQARLQDRALVDGSAQLDVVATESRQTQMSLSPVNLAIRSPRWTTPAAPARLGSGPDGDYALLVPASGTLHFAWTLAAAAGTDDLEFKLQLPRSPVNELELIVPEELNVSANHGVAVRQPASAADADGIDSGHALWLLEFGGNSDVTLHVRRRDQRESKVPLRQMNSYIISEHGVEMTADLHLDCDREPVTHLEFQIDVGLQVIHAASGRDPLNWTVVADRDGQSSSVAIAFDPPLRGLNRVVSLRAVSLTPATEQASLPRIRPQGLNWQQESARVNIQRPLLAHDLVLESARQIPAIDGHVDPDSDTLSVEFTTPDASIQVPLETQPPTYTYTSGTTAQISPREVTAKTNLSLQSQSPNLFEVEAEINAGWVVESVETDQSDTIHDWQLRSQGNATTLVISFRQPISAIDSFCTIRARRRRANEGPIPAAQLIPLGQMKAALPVRRFLVIHTDQRHVAKYRHDRQVTWLTLDDLDAEETLLIDASETDPIVLLDGLERELSVEVPAAPQAEFPFSADVRLLSRVTTRFVHEQIRVNVDRPTPPSPKLVVRLSETRDQPFRWFSENDPQRALTATRSTTADSGVEVWTVDWPDPLGASMTVVGERYFPPDDKMRLSLARVDDAHSQEGLILIEAPGNLDLEVRHSRRLSAAPPLREDFRRHSSLRKVFRYDPTPDIIREPAPLTVSILPQIEGRSQLCVWNATLVTRVDESGITRNRYSLQIENLGQTELSMSLSASSSARRLFVDGQESDLNVQDNGQTRIPLPATKRFCLVQVDYDEVGNALAVWQSLPCSRPEIDAPILSERWLIWTPPEYAIGGSTAGHESAIRACFRRVLGPFLRAADTAPFEVFSQQAWTDLVRYPAARAEIQPSTVAWIERLGDQAVERWGEISVVGTNIAGEEATETQPAPLWLDATRLLRNEVSPERPLPETEAHAPLDRGMDRLRKARLVVIECEDAAILTSTDFVAQHMTWLTPTNSQVVLRQPDLRLADFRSTARGFDSLPLIRATDWRKKTGIWTRNSESEIPYSAGGWQLFVRSPDEFGTNQVFYHRDTFLIAGSVAFLMALATAWWLRGYSFKLTLALVMGAVIGALLLPEPANQVGLGAVWGGLAAILLTTAPARNRAKRSKLALPLASTVSYRKVSILIIVATIASSPLIGQETLPGDPTPKSPPPHPVYVPANDTGEPQGDYLFVPPELHEALIKNASRIGGWTSDWLLESVTYRTSMIRQNGSSTPRAEAIQAQYQIHVAAVRAPVQLALPAESAALLEREARLNGRPFRLQWNANRSAITLPIRDSGTYELEVTYRLKLTTAGRIDLPIVPTPQSTLEVATQEDFGPILIASARGAVTSDETTGQIRADLGPVDRLLIQWGAVQSTDDPIVEQLSWLRIQPGRVLLNVKLLIDTRRWDSDLIRIEADERLRGLPESAEPVAIVPSDEPGVQFLEYEFAPSNDELTIFELNFVVEGQSGVGQMRLPRWRLLGVDAAPHELAVSVDPRLTVGSGSVAGADFQSVADFAAKWGGEETPDRAFQLQGPFSECSCTTTRVEVPSQADIQVAYEISRDETKMIYLANLTANSERFRQRLEVPEQLLIERVMLIDGSSTRELRWSRDASRELNVFFVNASTNSYQLAIVGRQRSESLGPRKLPRLRLLDSIASAQKLLVFRRGDVILTSDAATLEAEAPTQIDPFIDARLDLSRWYATITLVGEEDTPIVNVQANERRLSAELTNVVSRREDGWYHELHVNYTVDQGVLDAVRFEIPEVWLAGLRDNLEAKVRFGKSPRPGLVRITIWPETPFDLSKPMTIGGLIPISPGEPLQVPNIRLLEDGVIRRRLFLPVEIEGQPVRWNAPNLQRQDFDRGNAPAIVQDGNYVCYALDEDDFQATRLPSRTASGRPVVHLTDIRVAWNQPRSFQGQALIDLVPGGLSECLVRCPAGITPLAISVEGTTVDYMPTSDEGLRLELTSSELPQRIRILFQGSCGNTDKRADLRAPFIERVTPAADNGAKAIDVLRTLWTVRTPANVAVELRIDDEARRSNAELELIRLHTLASVLDTAAQMTTDFSRAELARWYRIWGERFAASMRRGAAISANQPTRQQRLDARIAELQTRYEAVVEQLDVKDIYRQLSGRNVSDLTDAWNETSPREARTQLVAFGGARSSMRARYRVTGEHDPLMRATAAMIVGLLGFGAILWIGREQLENLRWFHLFGVLCGLGWWLWMQPSALGWVIVAASLLSMRVLRWPIVRG